MRLQTLIATMYRDAPWSFIGDIHPESPVVVINQCNTESIDRTDICGVPVVVYSSLLRGISASRNEAILHADSDIFLTGDDDIVYRAGYAAIVTRAFETHPDADIIAFNTAWNHMPPRMIPPRTIQSWQKSPENRYYPSVSIAYRRSSFIRANLHFHPLFGTGSRYLNGEETIVLHEARKAGLRIYESPEIIADVDCSESTWFNGYDRRYFHDKGALVKTLYPHLYRLLKYYYLTKLGHSDLSVSEGIRAMNEGIRSLKEGT